MFGFLAAFGPVGITVAVVGTVGVTVYNYMKDDDQDGVTNVKETESSYSHRYEKNELIKDEIKSFKQKQKIRIKEKYDTEIDFVSKEQKENTILGGVQSSLGVTAKIAVNPVFRIGMTSVSDFLGHKDKVIILGSNLDKAFEDIVKLENEIDELSNLSKLLHLLKTKDVYE